MRDEGMILECRISRLPALQTSASRPEENQSFIIAFTRLVAFRSSMTSTGEEGQGEEVVGRDRGLCLPLSWPFDKSLPSQEALHKHPLLIKGGWVSRFLLYLLEKARAGHSG